jgi:adenylate cyclase
LVRKFGAQRGAEELTHYLNRVYDALISCLHDFGGSVISFAGDAITCWFDQDDGLHAAACALGMQEAMKQFSLIKIGTGGTPLH